MSDWKIEILTDPTEVSDFCNDILHAYDVETSKLLVWDDIVSLRSSHVTKVKIVHSYWVPWHDWECYFTVDYHGVEKTLHWLVDTRTGRANGAE